MQNREIKFRAWDNEKNIMFDPLYHDYLHFDELRERCSRYKIMQFIGLKDRNGKEIYEGDIVETQYAHKRRFVVEYMPQLAGYYPFTLPYDQKGDCWFDAWTGDEVKVIGNIYENPELSSV